MDANDFLMGGGGAPSASFPTPGTIVGGTITETPTVQQQKDIKTGDPLFWSDGNPRMQMIVTVQTDDRDPAIEDDDGKRRIFVKGQMKNAIQDAVRTAGFGGDPDGPRRVREILLRRYPHAGPHPQRFLP
ncbi:hypothetical protein ABZ863_35685, partial [Saccharomonospora sp. NPDC046836]|uniref:hypothetical protein n=1 Tax=Saccharomonospora sp. NPDC046836 TaxID=3156921 RepID=UPI0033FA2498